MNRKLCTDIWTGKHYYKNENGERVYIKNRYVGNMYINELRIIYILKRSRYIDNTNWYIVAKMKYKDGQLRLIKIEEKSEDEIKFKYVENFMKVRNVTEVRLIGYEEFKFHDYNYFMNNGVSLKNKLLSLYKDLGIVISDHPIETYLQKTA